MSELVTAAFCAEDAEGAGVRAAKLLIDPARAVRVLGGPNPVPTARYAVIQRFGSVGALLVIACEHAACGIDATAAGAPPAWRYLQRLLGEFAELGPHELGELLEAIECADGWTDGDDRAGAGEIASRRRWLAVTYAIAARDRTEEAHRAYLRALDRVLASMRTRS